MRAGSRLPASLLDRAVTGVNLVPGTLRDQLGDEATLLVFLRHFGCIFCRETIGDLRALSEAEAPFPPVIFFFQGSSTEGRAFLRRYWPEARAVADPALDFYEGFGIGRGRLLQMLGPSVFVAQSRARAKGYENGERTGDIWRMPGVFLVRGDTVVWSHEYRHAGEAPDYAGMSAEARRSEPGGPDRQAPDPAIG